MDPHREGNWSSNYEYHRNLSSSNYDDPQHYSWNHHEYQDPPSSLSSSSHGQSHHTGHPNYHSTHSLNHSMSGLNISGNSSRTTYPESQHHLDTTSPSYNSNQYYYDNYSPPSQQYYSSKSDMNYPSNTANLSPADVLGRNHMVNANETRHARRLYLGGIPVGQTSEEHLKSYLNEVISRCLGEDNNNSYIVSIYMNHKKCFAFVELKSIELTSACLELDGIVYCSSVLRIQRANEYKPELLAALPPLRPLKFNLSKAPFLENSTHSSKDYKRAIDPDPVPISLIRPCSIPEVTPGSIAIVGFPYDEGARRSGLAPGSAAAPGVLRFYLSKLLQSNMNNEFGVDLSRISILDVGDVPFGMALEEALSRLNDAIIELIKRGAVPIILGGSQDQSYAIAGGLMDVMGGNIGVVNVNSRLSVNQLSAEMKIEASSSNRLLFSDSRFCPPKDTYSSTEPSCDGKLVIYGAQGTYCPSDQVNYLQRRGGHIIWLSKDIRKQNIYGIKHSNPNSRRNSESSAADEPGESQVAAQHLLNSSYNEDDDDGFLFTASSTQSVLTRQSASNSIPTQFPKLLQHLSTTPLSLTLTNRSLYVSFSLSAIQDMASPGMSLRSPQGFTSEESLLLCRQAGVDPNVHIFDINGFNPTIEEPRTGCLIAEMIYQFLLGFSHRRTTLTRSQSRLGHHLSRNYSRSPVDSKSIGESTKTSNNSLIL